MSARQVRARFAPSLTAELRLEAARTALYNYLFARQSGGSFVLCLQDISARRSQQEFEHPLLEGLRWLGLRWDEGPDLGGPYGPYRQSERQARYQAVVEQLLATGHAYPCYCTPAELAEERARALAHGEMPRYSGRCAGQAPREREVEGRPRVIRLRVPPGEQVSFVDLVRGPLSYSTSELDDFVIYRPQRRAPLHSLAVTVDDHDMQISHVIRGEEHLPDTPRQILLYRALGWEPPAFAHLPPVIGKDRARLRKRESAASVAAYRSGGYLPEAVLNYLALLGWSPGPGSQVLSLEELVESFRLDRVSRGPAVFDPERLSWFNRQHMRAMPLHVIRERARPFLLRAYGTCERCAGTAHTPYAWLDILVDALRAETTSLETLADAAAFCLLDSPLVLTAEAQEALAAPWAQLVLDACAAQLRPEHLRSAEGANQFFTQLRRETKARHGLTGRQVMFPLRAALTGTLVGPCLGVVATLLGPQRCRERLDRARNS